MHPKVSILDTTVGRYMVHSTGDSLNRILLSDGVHEPQVLEVTNFILRNSRCSSVLDLGSNIGTYAIPVASHFPEKIVWGFEIQRNVFYQFCGNVFLNSLSNVRPINQGVSSVAGEIEIAVVDYSKCWNVGGFSIDETASKAVRSDFPSHSISGKEIGQVTTLDALRSTINDVGLIKIDVEGHEIEVLGGGLEFLKENGFPPIIFECWNFEWFRDKRHSLFEFLTEIGYSSISPDIGYSNYLAQSPRTSHSQYLIENSTIRVVASA